MRSALRGLAVLTLVLFLLPVRYARAGDGKTGWSATIYGGPASYSRVSDIFQGDGRINGGMVGFAVDKDLIHLSRDVVIGAEGQLTGYVFDHYYGTAAVGIGLRFDRFPWDNTSLAVYSGPSYALNPPKLIRNKYGKSFEMKKFLNYTGVEFAVAVPHHEQHWDMVLRIYHRSGAWGVYSNNVDEGSMIGVGIRARF